MKVCGGKRDASAVDGVDRLASVGVDVIDGATLQFPRRVSTNVDHFAAWVNGLLDLHPQPVGDEAHLVDLLVDYFVD